jgi:hypothetical protein
MWLWIIAAVLFVVWLVAVLMSYTLGGWIYALLVLAIIAALIQLFTGTGQGTGQRKAM